MSKSTFIPTADESAFMWKKRTERVLDQHSLRVARDEARERGLALVRQEDRGLVVAEVLEVELAKRAPAQRYRLVVHARRAELARDPLELDRPPRRARERGDLGEQLVRASS